jgi:hypothetical protein
MATIYGSAYLVVGASCARDSSQGFIRSTRYVEPENPVATIENVDGTTSKIHARRWRFHGDLCLPVPWRKDSSPLAQRGWTLQEQILSTRMVHFERNELFWECRASTKCECMELNDSRQYKRAMETEATNHSFDIWHTIVAQYHLRSLTHESDFLPALSGVVTRLQEYGAGDYLAGLWANDLHCELMWGSRVPSDRNAYVRNQPYRAPTWSWASLRRYSTDPDAISIPCIRIGSDFSPLSRVLHASCLPSGHDLNGALRSGEIIMLAKLVDIRPDPCKPEITNDLRLTMELRVIRD